eukprot:CAMPEP_0180012892 /NCGR_PEP_ID=MMETSP0984-20121128/17190_1 /TAXON_ID=483367 /ORGANISM="non described non described, Strain CCMP 2436" /LENGTH=277 /DNA_ID=CAMNT_0021935139 /DNA_START=22 /DNA_END=853 /DNA_ORIENTATION=-
MTPQAQVLREQMAWLSRGLAAVEPWLSREHILGLLALAVVGALTLAYAFARPRGVRASAGEGAQTRAEAIASARVKQQATMTPQSTGVAGANGLAQPRASGGGALAQSGAHSGLAGARGSWRAHTRLRFRAAARRAGERRRGRADTGRGHRKREGEAAGDHEPSLRRRQAESGRTRAGEARAEAAGGHLARVQRAKARRGRTVSPGRALRAGLPPRTAVARMTLDPARTLPDPPLSFERGSSARARLRLTSAGRHSLTTSAYEALLAQWPTAQQQGW